MKKKYTLKQFCVAGLFAAIIALATFYLQIPISPNGGYAHLGDTFIFICASFLPAPLAMIAAAVGAGIADTMAGFAVYIPATIIIKAASAAFFTSKKKNLLCVRNYIALGASAIFCVGGYYLYEVILTKSFASPIPSIPFNIAQWAVSAALYIIIAFVLDKAPNIKKYLRRNWHE